MNGKRRFRPLTATVIGLVHVLGLCAVWHMITVGFPMWAWISLVLIWFGTILGITISHHRWMTHQAFDCHFIFRRFFLALGAMAVQGPGIWWCEVHHQHHTYSDRDGDPHSPQEFGGGWKGFLWSHVGWMCFDVVAPKEYIKPTRFTEDPDLQWQRRYYLFFVLLGFVIPYLMAGWAGVFLGGFFRLMFCWNVAWGTNSFCHVFGSHAVDGNQEVIESRRARNFPLYCFFWLMATFSCGEFWHANHHARQRSAYIGWRWYEVDPGKWVILLAEKIGLVWNVRTPEVA